MKVLLSVKAEELMSSSTINMTVDPALYIHAIKCINELAEELKKLHDALTRELE